MDDFLKRLNSNPFLLILYSVFEANCTFKIKFFDQIPLSFSSSRIKFGISFLNFV